MADRAVSVLFLAIFVELSQIFSVDCGTLLSSLISGPFYNTSDGKVCYFCAPGQFWVGDCVSPGEVARCKPCENGYFQTLENIAQSCEPCISYCIQHYQDFIAVCNATTNNICQCKSGYFRFDEEGHCQKHSTCPPGKGVKFLGNQDRDTVCENCIAGKTFSGNDSATEVCIPCTSCGMQGLIETTPCTDRSNSECSNFTVTPRSSDKQGSLDAMIGGIIGGVLAVAVIITFATVCYRRKHSKKFEFCLHDSEGVPFTGEKEKSLDTVNSDINPPEEEKIQQQDRYFGYERKNNTKENVGLRHSQNSNVTVDSGCVSLNNNPSPGQGNFMDEDRTRVHMSHTGITNPLLQKLSKDLICHNWKFFFRCLSVPECEMEQVEIDHPTVHEWIYQLLYRLNQRGSLKMTDIIKSLESIGRNDLADSYRTEVM
ncbi:hypothetical protein CHS0354_023486 [Potamilus streckersoni]|uniref:Uncharacterized protein n=1 Tax=Potamilus streckersoni TaxID=2493646 RepID=A0AAE0S7X4_9BIVA|nr:hypothetical protein CHS0354_023486 [Potamilus streckersoni]